MKAWFVPFLAALLLARPAQDLERWLAALDAGREPECTHALESLSALGEPAAARALEGFESAGFAARRARARLLSEIPPREHGARLLALLADPDPEVRRLLTQALGNPALAESAAAERAAALERLLLEDPSARVRAQAMGALVESALAEAVPALDRAIERLPAGEAESAAAALARLPSGRERLIARVTAIFEGPGAARPDGAALPDGVVAALLRGYGRALAEVPGGGEHLRERLPFVRALVHPAPEVQAAVRLALANFLARAAELSEPERAERVLAELGREGWPTIGCLWRRLDLAWRQRGDAAGALDLAREMVREALALEPNESEVWDVRARFYEGAALYALGQSAQAATDFTGLAQRLEAARWRRDDLFPSPRASEWSEGGGLVQMDRQFLGAMAHLWLALLALERGEDDAHVCAELRAAHVLFLEARLVAARTGANDPSTLDALLDHELSPHSLVLFNEKLAPERRGRALDLAVALGEAFGRVAPLEMQGLGGSPAPTPQLGDVFADPVRLALLEGLRAAQLRELERRQRLLGDVLLGPRDPDARQNEALFLRQYRHHLAQAREDELKALRDLGQRAPSSAELRTIYGQLLDYLAPSMHAHTLAGELRAEGRASEARALCERALAVLATAPLGASHWSELSSARLELLRGSTLMDDGQPREAEQAYEAAERRLLAIETLWTERRAGADPATAAQYDGQLRAIRDLRGDALLSLAVNANVRLGDPARALEYFERAYALNQNAFMRVLRACYRARSKKVEEARTVLRSVVPVPSLYYNIACTHALMGEKDLALDYLERDLRENHPTAGARAVKLAWMRKDPDLTALHGEPRYERLVETER